MRSKWGLFPFVALVLLLTTSVVACGQTASAPSSSTTPTPQTPTSTPIQTPPANESEIHFEQGNMYLDKEYWDKAITEYSKAIELNPEFAEAFVGRAIANAWAGNYAQAENDFNTAYSMSYERFMTTDAYVAWGIAYTAQSDYFEAESCFNSAISLHPNNADAYTGRALMHLKEAYGDVIEAESTGFHRLGDAISDFEKAIELDPEGIQGRINRFNFEGEMAFLPNYIEANKRLGAVLVSTDIYRFNGLEEYARVLEVCPYDVEALIGRGNAYLGLQQYDLALDDFVKATQLDPDYPNIYAGCTSIEQMLFTKANTYLEQEEWYEAIDEYTKAIELNPYFAEAYANRALV